MWERHKDSPSNVYYYSEDRVLKSFLPGGQGTCCSRNCSFSNPLVGFWSMFIRAMLCRVTGSSSYTYNIQNQCGLRACCVSNIQTSSARGGMSVSASCAASTEGGVQSRGFQLSKTLEVVYSIQFFSWYSIAARRLNVSTSWVSCNTCTIGKKT